MRGSRALVTGASGLIGYAVVCEMLRRGWHVNGLDVRTSSDIQMLTGTTNFEMYQLQLGQQTIPMQALDVDTVVHCAAIVGVRHAVRTPGAVITNNVRGTIALLEAALPIRQIHTMYLCSSSEVYGAMNGVMHEDDPGMIGSTQNSRWSYASAKRVEEHLWLDAANAGKWMVVGRVFNAIGPRQSLHTGLVVPSMMLRARHHLPIEIHGSGMQTRCFCNVEDVASGIVGLVSAETYGHRVYNIGRDEPTRIIDLAEQIVRACGSRSNITHVAYSTMPEGFDAIEHRQPDVSRMMADIGWQAQVPLSDTIMQIAMSSPSSAVTI